MCARLLDAPLQKLAMRILAEGRWPDNWIQHWIAPLYKRTEVFKAGNYRGVHLTSQVSKAMERLLVPSFVPYLNTSGHFGCNQFGYQKERGARDALAFLVLDWIMSINKRRKVGVYCSDVSGAFDKVEKTRMVRKLRATGLHESLIAIFESWLRTRPANVIVSGDKSETIDLANMVFQGTVWGCICLNAFFHDSKHAVRKS